MFNSQCRKAVLGLKGIVYIATSLSPSSTQQCFRHSSSTFFLSYTTNTIASSGKHSFTVSYLINNFDFSPQAALNVSKQVHFETSQKPDLVVSFFVSHGFSKSQIIDVIRMAPWLLTCDPHTRVLPKFYFLLSKGASSSDIVFMTSTSPRFLKRSLEDHIIPTYQLLKGIFISDKATVDSIKGFPDMLFGSTALSINVLLENGVARSNIARILSRMPITLQHSNDVMRAVEELKGLGFNPLTSRFSLAFLAKQSVSKSQWEAKVDVYKKWGWSEEVFWEAFKKQPPCMLVSKEKIDAVMSFWVNHLGWDPLTLVKRPMLFGFSLKKRIIPRALVLQFLYSKGLRSKNACLVWPFSLTEKQFLEQFVKRFKEHDCELLKLYEENKNI